MPRTMARATCSTEATRRPRARCEAAIGESVRPGLISTTLRRCPSDAPVLRRSAPPGPAGPVGIVGLATATACNRPMRAIVPASLGELAGESLSEQAGDAAFTSSVLRQSTNHPRLASARAACRGRSARCRSDARRSQQRACRSPPCRGSPPRPRRSSTRLLTRRSSATRPALATSRAISTRSRASRSPTAGSNVRRCRSRADDDDSHALHLFKSFLLASFPSGGETWRSSCPGRGNPDFAERG